MTDATPGERPRNQADDRQMLIQAILDTAVDAIITIDEKGVVETFNREAERMFGYTALEVVGQNVRMLMPAPYHQEHASHLARFSASGNSTVVGKRREVHGRHKNGTVFPLELGVSELADGRRTFLGILRDLRARRQMEEELLRSQKMEAIGRLASGLAHNFNNLLAGVAGCCNIILGQLESSSPSRPYAEEISAALEQGSQITRELLAMGTASDIQRLVVDMNELVRRCEPILRGLIDEAIGLTVETASEGAYVVTVPGRLEQVLMNLVANARDAMPTGGDLWIRVTRSEVLANGHGGQVAEPGRSWVCLEVEDCGCGMDEETQRKAFEPFFTTKGPEAGTGLGLSTVYGIVKQHGGFIRLETQPGAGTTLRLFLPETTSPDPVADLPDERPESSGRGETVLLVEDDRLVRMSTRFLLEDAGFEVVEADRPSEAIAAASDEGRAIDVLVTDFVLPEMNGNELASRIVEVQPQVQVLYMSAYPARLLVAQGRLEPGTAFIEKPFKDTELVARIRSLLDVKF